MASHLALLAPHLGPRREQDHGQGAAGTQPAAERQLELNGTRVDKSVGKLNVNPRAEVPRRALERVVHVGVYLHGAGRISTT